MEGQNAFNLDQAKDPNTTNNEEQQQEKMEKVQEERQEKKLDVSQKLDTPLTSQSISVSSVP